MAMALAPRVTARPVRRRSVGVGLTAALPLLRAAATVAVVHKHRPAAQPIRPAGRTAARGRARPPGTPAPAVAVVVVALEPVVVAALQAPCRRRSRRCRRHAGRAS